VSHHLTNHHQPHPRGIRVSSFIPTRCGQHQSISENGKGNNRNHGLRKVPEAQQDNTRHSRRQEEGRNVLWLGGILIGIRREEEVGDDWPDRDLKGRRPKLEIHTITS
jgi:hypothetical protein